MAESISTSVNFAHSDDDRNSPEHLGFSQPIKDVYSSDECPVVNTTEKESLNTMINNEKFMEAKSISAKNIDSWEMVYFLGFKYSLFRSSYSCMESLLQSSFHFLFPDGVPKSFHSSHSGSGNKWDALVPKLIADFCEVSKDFQWFRDYFTCDYTTAGADDLYRQKQVLSSFIYSEDKQILHGPKLAMRLDQLFEYLCSNEEFNYEDKEAIKRCEQILSEKIRGMLHEILSFVGISIVQNEEGRLDFEHPDIPGRGNNLLNFRVKPELTMCVASGEHLLPYGVVQVYGTTGHVISEVVHGSEEIKVTVSDKTAKYEDKKLSIMNCDFHSISIENQDDITNVYSNTSLQEKINQGIRKCVPIDCTDNIPLKKMTAQLAMEMFGTLVQSERLLGGTFALHTSRPAVSEGLGLFVMNEHVYLSRISHQTKYLYYICRGMSRNTKPDGPSVVNSEFCFNLKKPGDRLALLILLYHFNQFQKYQVR